jgi:integrase
LTAVNSRLARPSTEERFDRLAKRKKALGTFFYPQECPDSSRDSFIFPNTDGGFMDTGNYRNRILIPLAEKLGLPKLNFQVLRRTMATLAQGKGSVKDIQAHLRHSKADTTANEYMQELPESVGRMVESMYEELMHSQTAASADCYQMLPTRMGALPLCV